MTPILQIGHPEEYARLLRETLPHVIHTEAENERLTAALTVFLRKHARSAEEDLLVELLTFLIEKFEESKYSPAGR